MMYIIYYNYDRLKVETQLLGWISKYDADIGEKQAEYDEIMAGFNEEKQHMDELQVIICYL